LFLKDKKENKQLAVNATMSTVATSSIMVLFDTFNSFSEVSTTKQIPNKLDDAFKYAVLSDWEFYHFVHSYNQHVLKRDKITALSIMQIVIKKQIR
jgi:hypothetical protein